MNEKTARPIYQKIMAQNGIDDFKALIEKWEILSENLSDKPPKAPMILPDLFLVSNSGAGRTHLLKLLAEYLSETPNLMDFYGDVKYFEFMLNYCRPGDHFSEIQRFMTEVDNAAGFRSEYRGIVYVDVDEWLEHFEEKHFVSFMEYLADNSNDWIVVLCVSNENQEQVRQMEAFVSAFIRIERIAVDAPTVDELTQYAKKILDIYGVTLSAQAENLVFEAIGELCKSKYFDGYKTVKRLCEDIVYALYTEGGKKSDELSVADLSDFAKDGEYIQRMIVKIEKTKRIGFC